MNTSTPHGALCIAEIYRNVCVVADDATLAVLARTCKYFHEPAVQMLWRDIPDLVPLIKLFPEDAWILENRRIVSFATYHVTAWRIDSLGLIMLFIEILSSAVSARLDGFPQAFQTGSPSRAAYKSEGQTP